MLKRIFWNVHAPKGFIGNILKSPIKKQINLSIKIISSKKLKSGRNEKPCFSQSRAWFFWLKEKPGFFNLQGRCSGYDL